MYLAYVDESGNVGVGRRGTLTFTLACVLLPAEDWLEIFDRVISFRRFLRARFDLPVRAEIKASHLLRNEGAFEDLALPEGMRHVIYRQAMRLHSKIGLQTFAVVIDKTKLTTQRPGLDPRDVAWEYLLQRLERASENPPLGPTQILLSTTQAKARSPVVSPARRVGPERREASSAPVSSGFRSAALSTTLYRGTLGSRTLSSLLI